MSLSRRKKGGTALPRGLEKKKHTHSNGMRGGGGGREEPPFG